MEKFNLSYYIKKDKTDVNGNTAIYAKLLSGGKSVTFFTGQKITRKRWKETHFLQKKTKNPVEIKIQDALEEIDKKIESIRDNAEKQGFTIDAAFLKKVYSGEIILSNDETKGFIEAFDLHNNAFEKLAKTGNKSTGSLTKYRTVRNHLSEFIKKVHKTNDIQLNKLKEDLLDKFDLYLRTDAGIENNTTVKYCRAAKRITKLAYTKHFWIDKPLFMTYEGKLQEVDTIYLTEDELEKIENKKMPSERLSIIKDIFLFSCYCGYAPADIELLTKLNLQLRDDGELWLMKRRTKTKITCNVPLLPQAVAILEKYKNHPDCVKKGKLLPTRSNQITNDYLKEIASMTGIEKVLTHYVGRHTFACLMLNNGVSIEALKEMMGHKRIEQTYHYAKLLQKNVSMEMKKVIPLFQERMLKQIKQN